MRFRPTRNWFVVSVLGPANLSGATSVTLGIFRIFVTFWIGRRHGGQFEKDGVWTRERGVGRREGTGEREDRVVIEGCGGSARLARDKQPRRSGESSRSTVSGPLTPVAPLGLRRIRVGNKTKVSLERHAALALFSSPRSARRSARRRIYLDDVAVVAVVVVDGYRGR